MSAELSSFGHPTRVPEGSQPIYSVKMLRGGSSPRTRSHPSRSRWTPRRCGCSSLLRRKAAVAPRPPPRRQRLPRRTYHLLLPHRHLPPPQPRFLSPALALLPLASLAARVQRSRARLSSCPIFQERSCIPKVLSREPGLPTLCVRTVSPVVAKTKRPNTRRLACSIPNRPRSLCRRFSNETTDVRACYVPACCWGAARSDAVVQAAGLNAAPSNEMCSGARCFA